jgi:uncharacterized protein (TIGR02118 family)
MIKVSVMYANKPGARFDHVYYCDKHMPLVKACMADIPNSRIRHRSSRSARWSSVSVSGKA